MKIIGMLKSHSDELIGTAGGVVLAPIAINKVGAMFNLGEYSNTIVAVGLGIGILILGKSKPGMAVPFAAVCFVQAALPLFPEVTDALSSV